MYLLLFLGFGTSLGSMLGVLGCWYYSYDDFATFVLHQVNKPNWRTYFETRVFPPYRYVIFPWLLLGAGMLSAMFTLML